MTFQANPPISWSSRWRPPSSAIRAAVASSSSTPRSRCSRRRPGVGSATRHAQDGVHELDRQDARRRVQRMAGRRDPEHHAQCGERFNGPWRTGPRRAASRSGTAGVSSTAETRDGSRRPLRRRERGRRRRPHRRRRDPFARAGGRGRGRSRAGRGCPARRNALCCARRTTASRRRPRGSHMETTTSRSRNIAYQLHPFTDLSRHES
jgi:hypothetical protein